MDGKKILDLHGISSVTTAIIDTSIASVVDYSSTNTKWSSFYFNCLERKNCHIMRLGVAMSKKCHSFSGAWEAINTDSAEAEYLNIKRSELNHTNGISFCEVKDHYLICLLLSGAESDSGFVNRVIREKPSIFRQLFHKQSGDFKQLITDKYIELRDKENELLQNI